MQLLPMMQEDVLTGCEREDMNVPPTCGYSVSEQALSAVGQVGRPSPLRGVPHLFLRFPDNQISPLSPSLSSLEQNER